MNLEDKLIKKLLISYEGFLCFLNNNKYKDCTAQEYKDFVVQETYERIEQLESFYSQIIEEEKELSKEFKEKLYQFVEADK